MSRPAYELAGVSFAFPGGEPVLSEVDLCIEGGEFVGIIGPNGSGKTTLLRILMGFLAPAAGQVLLGRQPVGVYSRRELARKTALMPQDTGQVFPYTALEMVLMGRAPYLTPWAFESRGDLEVAADAMTVADVVALGDRPYQKLSGGERQRVLFARTLAQETACLLLDEPTASLDLRHQLRLFQTLRRLHREEAKTLVVATHDINLAVQFCARLVLLHEGRIVAAGPPETVISAEVLRAVYGTDVYVGRHLKTRLPFVVPEDDERPGP